MAKKEDQASGENTSSDQAPAPRLVTPGRTVYVTDRETAKVHPGVVTFVNEDQSAILTVFKPHETVVGVGYAPAVGNLAAPGCWHWPV